MRVCVPELSPNPQFILFHSPLVGFYIIVRLDAEAASPKIEAGTGTKQANKQTKKTGKEKAAKRVVISRSSGAPCIYVGLSVGLK